MGMLFLSDIKGAEETILSLKTRYAAYAAEAKPRASRRRRASVACTTANASLKPAPLTEPKEKKHDKKQAVDTKSDSRRRCCTSTTSELTNTSRKPPNEDDKVYFSPKPIRKSLMLNKAPHTPTQYLRQKISHQTPGDGSSECDTWALSASTPISKSSSSTGARCSSGNMANQEPCMPSSLERSLRKSSPKPQSVEVRPPTEIFLFSG